MGFEGKQKFVNRYTNWIVQRYSVLPKITKHFDLDAYLANEDHGISHSANVRATTEDILGYLNPHQQRNINPLLLDALSIFHDIARFAKSPLLRRITRFRTHHELTGAALMRSMCNGDEVFGSLIHSSRRQNETIILEHDYHSPRLTPHLKPPSSLTSALFSLADKTSAAPMEEAQRRITYLTTRPRDAVPMFDASMTLEERRNWTFSTKARDALCAILPMFSYDPSIFTSDTGLLTYYQDWSGGLDQVKNAVLGYCKAENHTIAECIEVGNIIDIFASH